MVSKLGLGPGLLQGKTRPSHDSCVCSFFCTSQGAAGDRSSSWSPRSGQHENKTPPVEINSSNSVLQIRESRSPSRLRALLRAECRFPESTNQWDLPEPGTWRLCRPTDGHAPRRVRWLWAVCLRETILFTGPRGESWLHEGESFRPPDGSRGWARP